MPDQIAQSTVNALRAAGLSDSVIGRAVGLNSSAVAQIAGTSAVTGQALSRQRGAGYGAKAAPRLGELLAETRRAQSSMQAAAIARGLANTGRLHGEARTTKTGRKARVRQATRAVGQSGQGAILTGAGRSQGKAFDQLLAKAARNDQQVSLRVNMQMGDGSTKWITVKGADAEFWQQLRADAAEEDDGAMDLDDWLGMVLDSLAAEGELTSDLGDVIGFAAQVAA
jgi:hypothetical protein